MVTIRFPDGSIQSLSQERYEAFKAKVESGKFPDVPPKWKGTEPAWRAGVRTAFGLSSPTEFPPYTTPECGCGGQGVVRYTPPPIRGVQGPSGFQTCPCMAYRRMVGRLQDIYFLMAECRMIGETEEVKSPLEDHYRRKNDLVITSSDDAFASHLRATIMHTKSLERHWAVVTPNMLIEANRAKSFNEDDLDFGEKEVDDDVGDTAPTRSPISDSIKAGLYAAAVYPDVLVIRVNPRIKKLKKAQAIIEEVLAAREGSHLPTWLLLPPKHSDLMDVQAPLYERVLL